MSAEIIAVATNGGVETFEVSQDCDFATFEKTLDKVKSGLIQKGYIISKVTIHIPC